MSLHAHKVEPISKQTMHEFKKTGHRIDTHHLPFKDEGEKYVMLTHMNDYQKEYMFKY